jgi:hypothetical protein
LPLMNIKTRRSTIFVYLEGGELEEETTGG